MKVEDQVASVGPSKELKELSVKQSLIGMMANTMTQKTLFDEQEVEEEKEKEQEEDIKIGIRIAEAEMDHNIREAFNAASATKKKKAKQLLQEITAISLSGDEDAELDTFAKVLALEKVLGIS